MRAILATILALVSAGAIVHQATADTSAHPCKNCRPTTIYTNPNPGTCISVVVRISINNPDSLVDVTTTGQDSSGVPMPMVAGQQHHFLTRYDTIVAHEALVPVTIVFVID